MLLGGGRSQRRFRGAAHAAGAAGGGGGGASGAPDPTLLSLASSNGSAVLPDIAAWEALGVSALASGATYADPATGVVILKVTSSLTPGASKSSSNGNAVVDYAAAGPHVSLPWGASNEMRTIALVCSVDANSQRWFIDVDTSKLTQGSGNPVSSVYTGPNESFINDLWGGWSGNTSTPRVYICRDNSDANKRLRRWDFATSGWSDTGNFPKDISALWASGDDYNWVSIGENDTWITAQSDAGVNRWDVVAWNSETNSAKTLYVSDLTSDDIDETYIGWEGNFVVINLTGGGHSLLWDLSQDSTTVVAQGDAQLPSLSHGQVANDILVTVNDNSGSEQWFYDISNDSGAQVNTDTIVAGAGHRSTNWLDSNNSGSNRWYLYDHFENNPTPYNQTDPGALALLLCRTQNDQAPRILCHNYTVGSAGYHSQGHASISRDGKCVVFKSNMSNSGRVDTFFAMLPVTP